MKHISYGFNARRYEVQVIEGNRIVDSYCGGNCHWDSTFCVPLGDADAEPMEEMERMAKNTAEEWAEELGIDMKYVGYDPDIDEALDE